MITEDPRKTGLKNGLRQLTTEQLQRVLDYPGEMALDTYNYCEGKFCPLAVAIGLDDMPEPSHKKVFDELTARGYRVYNTRGIKGKFYTDDRRTDLLEAAKEVLEEKKAENCRKLLKEIIGITHEIVPTGDANAIIWCVEHDMKRIREKAHGVLKEMS